MKIKQKANLEYLRERQMNLRMLQHASRMFSRTKNEEFIPHMKWLSDRLKQIDRWRDDGTFIREAEKKEDTAKFFRDEYARMVKEGIPIQEYTKTLHLQEFNY